MIRVERKSPPNKKWIVQKDYGISEYDESAPWEYLDFSTWISEQHATDPKTTPHLVSMFVVPPQQRHQGNVAILAACALRLQIEHRSDIKTKLIQK